MQRRYRQQSVQYRGISTESSMSGCSKATFPHAGRQNGARQRPRPPSSPLTLPIHPPAPTLHPHARTSTYVSSFSSKYPLRLPFQKNVTCPNFCVSEHTKVESPFLARNSPEVPLIAGGGTKKLAGSLRSPSYCGRYGGRWVAGRRQSAEGWRSACVWAGQSGKLAAPELADFSLLPSPSLTPPPCAAPTRLPAPPTTPPRPATPA